MNVEQGGVRIDKYIAEKEELSRVAVQRLLDEGSILVNRDKVKAPILYNKGMKLIFIFQK